MANDNDDDRDHHEQLPSPGTVSITNPNITITLPTLRYGYRTTKVTWDELISIFQNLGVEQKNLAKMSRSRQQQYDYEVFRYHMKLQYTSSLDFLLISKFGMTAEKYKGKWKASQSLADMNAPLTRLVSNDFPYFVEDNIHHFILWKTKEPVSKDEIETVKNELRVDHGAVDVLYWVNPPSLQSIPEIDHVHFLFRNKQLY
jgi:Protein of unknown function (DUF3605)